MGRIHLENETFICLFNWDESTATFEVDLPGTYEVIDYWTDHSLGIHEKKLTIENHKPHSASLLKAIKIK